MKNDLKLYLWEDVLEDYTPGVIFALASSKEEAFKIVQEKEGDDDKMWKRSYVREEMKNKEPRIIDEPFGFVLWGGG